MSAQSYWVKEDGNLVEVLDEYSLDFNTDKIPLSEIFDIISREESLYLNSQKWFYLNNVEIFRSDLSGNEYSPKVKFAPCYVEVSDNIKQIINEGINTEESIESNYYRINRKLSEKSSVPITCVIECCQATDKDFWKVMEGELVTAKTSSNKVKVPKESPELQEILIWILTEGHIPLSHPSIEINQISSNSKVLDDLAKKFEKLFDSSGIVNFSSTDSWRGESGERLIVSSAPVRQLLVLKYNIPLGKKSRKLNQRIQVNNKNYENLLRALIQTEGSINQSQKQVRFEFKIQDENIREICYTCLEKLGCKPSKSNSQNTFDVGVYNYEGILKLLEFMKSQLPNRKITKKTEELLLNSNVLSGLKNQKWSKYVQQARKQLGKHPNQKFVEIHNRKFSEHKINHRMISNSALNKTPVRLSVAVTALHILQKPIEENLPNYIQAYISSVEFHNHELIQP